ncbi:MAG: hypothetical protein ACHQD8_01325 [Chitinophagales bacterium]
MAKKKIYTFDVDIILPDPKHIVIHNTGTQQDVCTDELHDMPYHFLILKNGKIIPLNNFLVKTGNIEIAYLGGKDNNGRCCDNRTKEQNEALFTLLVKLTELFPKAHIVGADQLYVYSHANPGFDIKSWLQSYIPEFLEAA